jgi:hypothetical protein
MLAGMPPPADLETLIYKLKKRGFHQDDVHLHECPSCHERGVAIFAILGRSGGRDIRVCLDCGHARSWRAGAGMEERTEDTEFDLRAFLR